MFICSVYTHIYTDDAFASASSGSFQIITCKVMCVCMRLQREYRGKSDESDAAHLHLLGGLRIYIRTKLYYLLYVDICTYVCVCRHTQG